ncbi:hypothetical protein V6N13_133610 [Hibiscus sabdariffa]
MLPAPEPLDQVASTFSIQDGEKSSIQLDAGSFLKLAARTGLDRACKGRKGWLLFKLSIIVSAATTPYLSGLSGCISLNVFNISL